MYYVIHLTEPDSTLKTRSSGFSKKFHREKEKTKLFFTIKRSRPISLKFVASYYSPINISDLGINDPPSRAGNSASSSQKIVSKRQKYQMSILLCYERERHFEFRFEFLTPYDSSINTFHRRVILRPETPMDIPGEESSHSHLRIAPAISEKPRSSSERAT